jgi:hypothetical protein
MIYELRFCSVIKWLLRIQLELLTVLALDSLNVYHLQRSEMHSTQYIPDANRLTGGIYSGMTTCMEMRARCADCTHPEATSFPSFIFCFLFCADIKFLLIPRLHPMNRCGCFSSVSVISDQVILYADTKPWLHPR